MRKQVNLKEIMLDNILCAMEDVTFSRRQAAAIVGGATKLQKLIEDGKISADRELSGKRFKWHCNAADCLRNVRQARS